MSLIDKLEKKDPERDFLFTAIEDLKDPKDIKKFYHEYILWIYDEQKKESKTSDEVKNPKEIASSNIGYAVGYYNKETADLWMGTLPISHPFFGREIPFEDDTRVSAYVIVFKAKKKDRKKVFDDICEISNNHEKPVDDSLVDKFKTAFSKEGFQVIDNFFPSFKTLRKEDKNAKSAYAAVKLKVAGRGECDLRDNDIYCLLCGYVRGIQSRHKSELGYQPEMWVERINQ